jgi:hypothetical protein
MALKVRPGTGNFDRPEGDLLSRGIWEWARVRCSTEALDRAERPALASTSPTWRQQIFGRKAQAVVPPAGFCYFSFNPSEGTSLQVIYLAPASEILQRIDNGRRAVDGHEMS